MPAARKQAQTKNMRLNSIEERIGVFKTYLVNTLRQTMMKNKKEVSAVSQ